MKRGEERRREEQREQREQRERESRERAERLTKRPKVRRSIFVGWQSDRDFDVHKV